jgi:hypothetical protein
VPAGPVSELERDRQNEDLVEMSREELETLAARA